MTISFKQGDLIAICPHFIEMDLDSNAHFFEVEGGFTTTTIGKLKVDWMVCCNDCFNQANGDIKKIQMKEMGRWENGELVIRR